MSYCVIIPDIHQNTFFLKDIVEYHDRKEIICLGDYFDTNKKNLPIVSFCEYLKFIYESKKNITFLVGNHDIQYFEYFCYLKKYNCKYYANEMKYLCSGFSKGRAKKICSIFKNSNFFNDLKLFEFKFGHLMSHAGFHSSHFSTLRTLEENLSMWDNKWNNFKNTMTSKEENEIWKIGECRGGNSPVGSPIWLDFFYEFKPIDGLKQIFGHTGTITDIFDKIVDGNICLDNGGYYAIIHEKDSDVEILKY